MPNTTPNPGELDKLNHFPDHISHRDLRSHIHACNRHRKQSQKYYGYRSVHPSLINQPCLRLTLSSRNHPSATIPETHLINSSHAINFTTPAVTAIALSEVNPTQPATSRTSRTLASLADSLELPTTQTLEISRSRWTRRDLFEHKQDAIWPLDVRHHRGKKIREKKAQKYFLEDVGRREKQRAARVRDPVRENEVACCDGCWERGEQVQWEDCSVAVADEEGGQGHEVVEPAAVPNPAELAAGPDAAESVLSLEDFDIVTDLESAVGDDGDWELMPAWSI